MIRVKLQRGRQCLGDVNWRLISSRKCDSIFCWDTLLCHAKCSSLGQKAKDKIPYEVTSLWNLIHGSNEPIYRKETNSWAWRTDLWLPGWRGRECDGGGTLGLVDPDCGTWRGGAMRSCSTFFQLLDQNPPRSDIWDSMLTPLRGLFYVFLVEIVTATAILEGPFLLTENSENSTCRRTLFRHPVYSDHGDMSLPLEGIFLNLSY